MGSFAVHLVWCALVCRDTDREDMCFSPQHLQVVIADIDESVGVAVCHDLQTRFGKAEVAFVSTDVTDSEQLVRCEV